jgi:hypothetical protein
VKGAVFRRWGIGRQGKRAFWPIIRGKRRQFAVKNTMTSAKTAPVSRRGQIPLHEGQPPSIGANPLRTRASLLPPGPTPSTRASLFHRGPTTLQRGQPSPHKGQPPSTGASPSDRVRPLQQGATLSTGANPSSRGNSPPPFVKALYEGNKNQPAFGGSFSRALPGFLQKP